MANLNDLYNQRNKFFDQKRQEAIGQVNAQNQEQQDALQRRFTAMGAANTGAAISAQQKQSEASAAQKRQVENDIAGQQMQLNEGDIGRQFQSEEAQKGRDFTGREAQLARDFSAGESQKGRDFSKGLSEQDLAFKKQLADTEQANKLKQMDMAERQFALDKDAQAFNQRMAEIAAQPDTSGPFGLGNELPSVGILKKAGGALGIGSSDRGGLGISVGGASCFLTTAACGAMNLPDDCWVLTLARKFRDNYMVQTIDRAHEIVDYYQTAPQIVEAINKEKDAILTWKRLFWKNIIPFVMLVEDGHDEKAHEKYKELITEAKKHLEVGNEQQTTI